MTEIHSCLAQICDLTRSIKMRWEFRCYYDHFNRSTLINFTQLIKRVNLTTMQRRRLTNKIPFVDEF